ncbi:RNA-binding domain-containing protein [Candidatus Palauibacter sp.]|uniref:RNA-binding domain-containing protein n=1 Tax=Candidatus Palauibacter sp. TaxID=3101350 RepID=UPI003B01DB28
MLDLTKIPALLDRLDGEPADALESDTLEFKSWDPHGGARRTQIREVRETVVAFANANGGIIVLGVADNKRTRADAIHGVAGLEVAGLRRDIYDGTDPHLLVDVEELELPEARILVVRVPRGIPPHTTSDGVSKIRLGKENKPLTGSTLAQLVVSSGGRDPTAEVLAAIRGDDLDPAQFRLLRQTIRADAERRDLAELRDEELLGALGLASGSGFTLAAVLLLGSPAALARHVPGHEVIFSRWRHSTRYDLRQDIRGPLLATLEEVRRLLDANLHVATIDPVGFQQLEIPDITWWVAREAVLNALVHRDYFLRQSTHVDLRRGWLEVVSPGGFMPGVTAGNILRHRPVRRNPLLAEALQTMGLVNRAGLGVDRIYEELLSLGKGIPRYDADESQVRLVLHTRTHAAFARLVYDLRRRGIELSLDDLIALRGSMRRGFLDRWSAAELLQLTEEEAAAHLVSLRKRGFFIAQGRGRGTVYRLARRYTDLLVDAEAAEQDLWIDEEALRLRLLAILSDRDRLTNAEIRRISGYTRTQVIRFMRSMRAEGLVEVRGRGRGAHYVPCVPTSSAKTPGVP